MAKKTERSKKKKTAVGQDEQLAFECAVYEVLGKLERDRGSTSKRKGKSAAELKNGLASLKSALAEWRMEGGAQSAMLAAVLKQYLVEMESDCARREDEVKPPEQAQGQTDGGPTSPGPRLRPGLMALLPDLCLLTVFRQLPLEDQFTTQRVCRRFAVLGQEVMRNRRSLTLLFSRGELHCIRHHLAWESNLQLDPNDMALVHLVRKAEGSPQFPTRPATKWNSLRYDSLTEAIVLELGQTFSGSTKLQIGGRLFDNTALTLLARLLEQNPQLVALRLFGTFGFNRPGVEPFNRTLSSLHHLKQLTIDLNISSFEGLTSSFIAQLDVFSFKHFSGFQSNPINFSGLCQELNDQQHPPAIYFHSDSSSAASLVDLYRLDGPLRRQLKQLYFRDCTNFHEATYIDDLGRHCAHFPSLVTLVLRSLPGPMPGDRRQPTITWRAILGAIVQLRQLLYLELSCEALVLEPTPGQLPQLPSLKVLHLTGLRLKSHRHLETMQLGWTMPNLQVLRMELRHASQCSDCHVDGVLFYTKCNKCGQFYDDQHPVGQVLNCLRQFFRSLKRQSRQLHTIRHNYEDRFGTVEQLLAE